MIKKYTIDVLQPTWPKWKKAIGNIVLNNLTILNIRRINNMIERNKDYVGGDFIDRCISDIGFDYELHNHSAIPTRGAVTVVGNHPGGADVLATLAALWKVRKDIKILANALVCIEQVKDQVIPVDVMRKNGKVDTSLIEQAYKNKELVVFFAAGMNSRYNDQGELKDRRWRTTFLDYAYKHKTPLVVYKINSSNTPLFYNVSKIRAKYSFLKNIPLENMFQLREIVKQKGRKVDMYASDLIPFETWSEYYDPSNMRKKRILADSLYNYVYDLDQPNKELIWPRKA